MTLAGSSTPNNESVSTKPQKKPPRVRLAVVFFVVIVCSFNAALLLTMGLRQQRHTPAEDARLSFVAAGASLFAAIFTSVIAVKRVEGSATQ
jgi:hypothetical protein